MAQEPLPGTSSIPVQQTIPAWIVNARQRDPPIFCGLPRDDVEVWLKEYDMTSVYNQWDEPQKLRHVAFYLSDVAKTWFFNHESSFPDWPTFAQQVRRIFGKPNIHSEVSKRKLDGRAQHPGETYTSYIEDVLALCHRVNSAMTEADRVRHIIKGIGHVAFNALAVKNPTTVEDVITTCQHLDELQAIRLHPDYPDASDSRPSSDADLRALIRTLIREELQAQGLSCAPAPRPHSQSAGLRDIIKEELSSMAGALPSNTTAPPTPPMTYAQVAAMPPALVQHAHPVPAQSNVAAFAPHSPVPAPVPAPVTAPAHYAPWRSPRPICYYCGIRGHISRFCRKRQQDERRGYDVYERDSEPSPNQYQRRPTTRSFSPTSPLAAPRPCYPGRRRSPSPLRRSTSPLRPAVPTSDYHSEN